MKTFDGESLKKLGDDIITALRPVAMKFEIEISIQGGSYGQGEAKLTLSLKIPAPSGTGASVQEEKDFVKYANCYGLKTEWLHKTFKGPDGFEYQIVGLSMRSRKFPVRCKRLSNGRFFNFEPNPVKWESELKC